jgi:hypothetical protein
MKRSSRRKNVLEEDEVLRHLGQLDVQNKQKFLSK